MRPWIIAAASLVAPLAFAGGLAWAELSGAFIEELTPEQLDALLRPDVLVVRPEGEGPFPAVVLFHGCGGLWAEEIRRPVMDDYAEIAREAGVVAVIVDSLKPRNIGLAEALDNVCSGWELRGAERAGDVAVGYAFARALPYVDRDRIALAGWSHGAWAIMDALAMNPEQMRPHNLTQWPEGALSQVQGAFLVYPYCGFPAMTGRKGWTRPVPAEVILVRDDSVADEIACQAALESLRADGVPVELHWFEEVTHGFDERDTGGRLRFSEEAAERAVNLFREFLGERVL